MTEMVDVSGMDLNEEVFAELQACGSYGERLSKALEIGTRHEIPDDELDSFVGLVVDTYYRMLTGTSGGMVI